MNSQVPVRYALTTDDVDNIPANPEFADDIFHNFEMCEEIYNKISHEEDELNRILLKVDNIKSHIEIYQASLEYYTDKIVIAKEVISSLRSKVRR